MLTPRQTLPIELYQSILRHVKHQEDLVALSTASRAWQLEAERVIWESVTLSDDAHFPFASEYADESVENLTSFDFIALPRLQVIRDRVGVYVQRLTLKIQNGMLVTIPLVASPPDGQLLLPRKHPLHSAIINHKEIRAAIRGMTNVRRLVISDNSQLALSLMIHRTASHAINFESLSHIEDHGSIFDNNFAHFIHSLPSVTNITSSSTIVARTALSTITKLNFSYLTTFSGHPTLASYILSSRNCQIRDLSIFVSQEEARRDSHFAIVSTVESVEILRLGVEDGFCLPFDLDYVQTLVDHFPNLRELRRVPISESKVPRAPQPRHGPRENKISTDKTNISRLRKLVANSKSLNTITIADHSSVKKCKDPNHLARSLREVCPSIRQVVVFRWIAREVIQAVRFKHGQPQSTAVLNFDRGLSIWN